MLQELHEPRHGVAERKLFRYYDSPVVFFIIQIVFVEDYEVFYVKQRFSH